MPSFIMESMSDLLLILSNDQEMGASKVITITLLVNVITNYLE